MHITDIHGDIPGQHAILANRNRARFMQTEVSHHDRGAIANANMRITRAASK